MILHKSTDKIIGKNNTSNNINGHNEKVAQGLTASRPFGNQYSQSTVKWKIDFEFGGLKQRQKHVDAAACSMLLLKFRC